MPSDNSSGVFAAWTARDVFVRVIGRGTYQNAESVRQFGKQWLERSCHCFHIDLAQCAEWTAPFWVSWLGLG